MIIIDKFGDRTICIGGVGKIFYQEGVPVSMSISKLKEKGIEVSILHVADECLKNGWSAKTTLNRLMAEIEDDIDKNYYDIPILEKFCNATYEEQREMIFNFLFESKENALGWARTKIRGSVQCH